MQTRDCQKYVDDLLKVELRLYKRSFPEDLPIYFQREYSLYMGKIFEQKYIVLFSDSIVQIQIKSMKKRLQVLSKSLNKIEPIIYVVEDMDWYTREQFIKSGIAFIVPGKQLYLPFLGIALSERYGPAGIQRKQFTPSAQYIIIKIITMEMDEFSLSDFRDIGITKMSVSRALNELVQMGVINKSVTGRDARWSIDETPKEIWDVIQPYLFNPVMKTLYVKDDYEVEAYEKFLEAGESTLSRESNLGMPNKHVVAVYSKVWREVSDKFKEVPKHMEDSIEVQVWKHKIPKYKNEIHPLALAASFIGENDERIEMSIDDMMNDYWHGRSY